MNNRDVLNVTIKGVFMLAFMLFTREVYAQHVEIYYYDKVMRVVNLPDYLINIQTDNMHQAFIRDSTLVSIIKIRIDSLVRDDSIPQSYNSRAQVVYVYENGNFDVITIRYGIKKNSVCMNGRMYQSDNILCAIGRVENHEVSNIPTLLSGTQRIVNQYNANHQDNQICLPELNLQ